MIVSNQQWLTCNNGRRRAGKREKVREAGGSQEISTLGNCEFISRLLHAFSVLFLPAIIRSLCERAYTLFRCKRGLHCSSATVAVRMYLYFIAGRSRLCRTLLRRYTAFQEVYPQSLPLLVSYAVFQVYSLVNNRADEDDWVELVIDVVLSPK